MIRSINNSLFIAKKYLCFHWIRTVMLVTALSIIIFVPLFLDIVVNESKKQLTSRGELTPLLLGAKGSSLDLTVNSLYFLGNQPQELKIHEAQSIDATGLAMTIPLYNRFSVKKNPIIGTTQDYFSLRNLQLFEGQFLTSLGDAVIGASFARDEGLKAGDSIISSPENLFDLAGVYPLKMTVVGVLEPTGTADDHAVFVDIKTSWTIAGMGHGHENLAHPDKSSIITSSARLHNTITKDNIDRFHFHGDESQFPITAAIVVPADHKSETILLGRYQKNDQLQLLKPKHVIHDLVQSIFRIKKVFDTVVKTVIVSTLLTIGLVFLLSYRLRAKEIETIFRLGCSRLAIGGFILSEIFIIFLTSVILTAFLLLISRGNIEAFILQMMI